MSTEGSMPSKSKEKIKINKNVKKSNVDKAHVQFSSKSDAQFLPSVFSPFWGELFGEIREKTLGFTIYFSLSSSNQIYSKKVFFIQFSLQSFPFILFHL